MALEAVAVGQGRDKNLGTPVRDSSALEEKTTAPAAGIHDRWTGRIPRCLDWVERPTVATVEIVDADAPHKHSLAMDKPLETV